MGKSGGVILGIVMVAVLFILFPIVMDSSHTLQTDVEVETEAAVATGVGETSADVVLTHGLWGASNTAVTSITSDEVTDVPVAGTYVDATKTLTVTGLVAEDSRTLTITYEYDGLSDYTGMGAIVAVAPLLLFLGVIGAVIGGLYTGFKS